MTLKRRGIERQRLSSVQCCDLVGGFKRWSTSRPGLVDCKVDKDEQECSSNQSLSYPRPYPRLAPYPAHLAARFESTVERRGGFARLCVRRRHCVLSLHVVMGNCTHCSWLRYHYKVAAANTSILAACGGPAACVLARAQQHIVLVQRRHDWLRSYHWQRPTALSNCTA